MARVRKVLFAPLVAVAALGPQCIVDPGDRNSCPQVDEDTCIGAGCCWDADPLMGQFAPKCFHPAALAKRQDLPVAYVALACALCCFALIPHVVAVGERLKNRAVTKRNETMEAAAVRPQPNAADSCLIEEVAEEDQLKLEWSGISTSGAAPTTRLESVLEGAPPEKVAILTSSGTQITYGQFQQKSSAIAAAISPMMTGENPRCALFMKRSPEMLFGMLGILKAGAAYIPLPPSFPEDRIKYVLEDSGAQLIVTMGELLPQLTQMAVPVPIVNVSDLSDVSNSQLQMHFSSRSADDTCVIFYTSGSTGKPKGVDLSHAAEATAMMDHAQRSVRSSDKVLQHSPFNFDVSLTEIFGTLAAHATLVLSPPSQQDMAGLNRVMDKLKPDVVQMIPSVFNVYTGFHGIPKSPRWFGFAGEALPVKVWMDLQQEANPPQVVNLYGPTEVSVYATYFGPEPMMDMVSQQGSVPIGRPLRWRECYVMSAEGEPKLLTKGAQGELWLAGAGLANGYVNLPEKTAKTFVPHPFRAGERAYRTGDLVRWLDTGDLLYLGRIDTQIKLHGLRIELEEIENVLREDDSVVETAVVKHEPPEGEPCLVAYISPSSASSHEALAKCRAKLPAYMVPSAVVPIDDWPRGGSGKIDRPALAARPLDGQAETAKDGAQVAAAAGVVMGLDSLAQMRLFNRQAVQERMRMQTLVGMAVVVMCQNHWEHGPLMEQMGMSTEAGEILYWGLAHLFTPLFLDIFVMFAAYTEATAVGLDGISDAFRFTVHEALLILIWLGWSWPFMQLQAAFLQILSLGDCYGTTNGCFNSVLQNMDTTGYRWLLLFLVLAKAYTVLVHKLRVPAWIQLPSLGIAYLVAMVTELPWVFPFSYIPGQKITALLRCKGGVHCPGSLVDYSPAIYILYLFIYVGTVYYGPSLVQWCSHRRHLCKTPWKNSGVRLLALLGVLVLHIDPTGMPKWAGIFGLLTEPAKLILVVLCVPRSSIFAFMGRYLLGTFLTHLALKDIICFTGLKLHFVHSLQPVTVTLVPSMGSAVSWMLGGLPKFFLLEALLAFAVLTIYSVVFSCVIGPLFQTLIVKVCQTVTAFVKFLIRCLSCRSTDAHKGTAQ